MSVRARFNRVVAGALVLLWCVGLLILSAVYLSGGRSGWALIIVSLNAPLVWKLLLHAKGERPAP